MKEVFIFDIDGCVMAPIFANFNNDETREKIVGDAVQNGNGIKLFPDFIKYYKINCISAELVYFITGRKQSEFGDLTDRQLQPLLNLKKFDIIYYPESKPHKIQEYFDWKANKINKVIEDATKQKSNKFYIETLSFNIFDDMDDYFSIIRNYGKERDIKIHFTLIESELTWNRLIQ
ncbi:MAG: hypothetical protein ACW98D_20130 [Promethearchaeota archaeon]